MAKNDYKRGTGRGHRPERRISIRGVRREKPDLRRYALVAIALAQAQAEAEAEAEAQANQTATTDDGLTESKEAA